MTNNPDVNNALDLGPEPAQMIGAYPFFFFVACLLCKD